MNASAQSYDYAVTPDIGARATIADGLIITSWAVVSEDAVIAAGTVY